MKYNLGCGTNKLEGYINVDGSPECSPDLLLDIRKTPWDIPDDSAEEVVLFHTIEHIEKQLHPLILSEIQRILDPKVGIVYISYPEFSKITENWKTNHLGKKDFWEATIYGRQLRLGDYHVSLMHTPDFIGLMKSIGFERIKSMPEPLEDYNTAIQAVKGVPVPSYEDVVRSALF